MTKRKIRCIIIKKKLFRRNAVLKKIHRKIKKMMGAKMGEKGSFLLLATLPFVLLQAAYTLYLTFSLGEYEMLCRADEIAFSAENIVMCLFISVLGSVLYDIASKRTEKEGREK